MTEDIKSLREKLNKKISGHKTEYKAVMGNPIGQVRSIEIGAGEHDVYVTLYSGDVISIHNGRLPLYPYRKIIIGYDSASPNRLQVLRWDDVYRQSPPPAVTNHARQHEWDAVDALRVNKKQVIAGLLPRADGMNLLIYGGEYYCDGTFCTAQNMTIDMTTELAISTGAKWVNVEIDTAGVITYQSSATVAGRALLTPDNIPVTASDKLLVCSIRAYAGQSGIIDTRIQSDIYDPRFIRGSGGGGFSGDPLRVVYTDSAGTAKTSNELAFNEADDTLTIGDPVGTGDGDGSSLHKFVGDKTHSGIISSYYQILTYAGGAAKSSLIKLISSLGTKASPLAVALDTILGRIQFYGYDGDTRTADSAASARIQSLAAEGFTSSAHGTKITVATTPNGSTTMQDVAEFGESGQIKLNQYGSGTYTGTAAKNLSVTSSGDVIESALAPTDGWIPVTETWTYASASTITIPSDGTTKYKRYMKIRFKQGGGWKYYVATEVASTLITVAVNTDYTVANDTITDISYSFMDNPYGFPAYFNFSPTWNNLSVGNGTLNAIYIISGCKCNVIVTLAWADTSPTSSVTGLIKIAPPITVSSKVVNYNLVGNGSILDKAVAVYDCRIIYLSGYFEVRVIATYANFGSYDYANHVSPLTSGFGAGDVLSVNFTYLMY